MSDFDATQRQINDFCAALRTSTTNATGGSLPLFDALFCAEDVPRNRAFWRAITAAVTAQSADCMVVDAGAGIGVLGIFALLAGAQRCYFIEDNPQTLAVCRQLVGQLCPTADAVFVAADATAWQSPEPINLLISETITTGFVSEDFPQIINHLRPQLAVDGQIIPASFEWQCGEQRERVDCGELLERSQFVGQISGSATLFGDEVLRSGECVSFLNPRVEATA